MYRYFVVCGGQVVYQTDSPRDAHSMARFGARQLRQPAFVLRTICRWQMKAVRKNA